MVSEALRAVSLAAPLAAVDAPAAFAQAAAPAPLASAIPAQPLAGALAAFASQTGLQLVYVSQLVRNQRSHAVPAGLGAREALIRLLRGTGLRFEYLTPYSIRIVAAQGPPAAAADGSGALEEIVVTASRREEAVRDVPIAIQALTGATLARLNATTFEDFVGYLPGITAHGVGPAQNTIYMRGLGTGELGLQAGASNSPFPNVALYLDEQSAQLPGRNLDVYAADLDRIEVLEGPQGTLFGAGAEAGVLRYITRKPQLNLTELAASAGYAATAHGGPGNSLSAVVNLPLVADRLAVRAVIYDDRRGGYISNIPATFARAATDAGIAYAGGAVPANSVVLDNYALVASHINPVSYRGVRAQVLYQFSEDWRALLAQSYQDLEADGVFTEMAANSLGQPQPDLTVQLFNPSYDRDSFENTALTVEGRLGALSVLYAGSYLERKVDQVQDYTNYVHGGPYVDYYQCIPGPSPPAQCFSPSVTWHNQVRNTHLSQELRLRTPDDWRLRAVGGLFYENLVIHDQADWFYLTAQPYFVPIAPPTGYWAVNGSPTLPNGAVVSAFTPGAVLLPGGVTSNNPNVRPPGDGFFNDITRGNRQRAVYASGDFELIPRTLTLTVGTRYYSTNSWEVGSDVTSFGCNVLFSAPVPDPCVNRVATNLNALGFSRTYTGFKSRANLSWSPSEDALLYYTWSQGFRSGGFNRGFRPPFNSPLAPGDLPWQAQAHAHGGWVAPLSYPPDTLSNNEIGWKTSWLGERLRWIGALYQEEWDHAQVGALDTPMFGSSAFAGPDYRVRGIETSGAARIGGGITVEFGAAWNHSEQIRQAPFVWADGTSIDFSTLRTASGAMLSNPAGSLGDPLAGAPPFQGNVRIRYEVTFRDYDAFAQFGVVHQSHSIASTDRLALDVQGNSTAYDLPPFTTWDATFGLARDAWQLQIYGQNLGDTRAQLYANNRQYYRAVTVNRPRTIGLQFGWRFRG